MRPMRGPRKPHGINRLPSVLAGALTPEALTGIRRKSNGLEVEVTPKNVAVAARAEPECIDQSRSRPVSLTKTIAYSRPKLTM